MKINESRIKEIIAEEMAAIEDKQYFDYTDKEGGMAKRQLEHLAQYAHELASMMEDDTQLESWVQSKITLASDYISKVKHYLEDELGMAQPACGQTAEPLMVVDGDEVYDIEDEDAYLMES